MKCATGQSWGAVVDDAPPVMRVGRPRESGHLDYLSLNPNQISEQFIQLYMTGPCLSGFLFSLPEDSHHLTLRSTDGSLPSLQAIPVSADSDDRGLFGDSGERYLWFWGRGHHPTQVLSILSTAILLPMNPQFFL